MADAKHRTPVQYGSSAGMSFSSERRKIPCLKTSFESEAPIAIAGVQEPHRPHYFRYRVPKKGGVENMIRLTCLIFDIWSFALLPLSSTLSTPRQNGSTQLACAIQRHVDKTMPRGVQWILVAYVLSTLLVAWRCSNSIYLLCSPNDVQNFRDAQVSSKFAATEGPDKDYSHEQQSG